MNFRPGLRLALMAICLLAGGGYCQFVEDSIQVPGAWVGSLAYNSVQDEVWGQTWSGNCVFVIRADSNRVVASIPLTGPFLLGFDSTDNKMYVSYQGAEQDSLAIIDGATHATIKRMEMPGATMPVWDPLSNRLYVSCQYDARVAVLDCATDSLLAYIPVGACPMKMYINTLRRKLYVLNYDAGSVSIVNMLTNQVIKTVVVGGNPNAGYYSRSADKFFTGGPNGQCVVVGGLSDTIVARIAMPGTEGVLSATGNEQAGVVFTGMVGGNTGYLYVVDAASDSVICAYNLGHEAPWVMSHSPASGLLYCGTAGSVDGVLVLAGDGSRILKHLPVGNYPFAFAFANPHRRLYVGYLSTPYVYVLMDTPGGIAEEASDGDRLQPGIRASPSPFTDVVQIRCSQATAARRAVNVFSLAGGIVRTLKPGKAGWWPGGSLCWDGRDEAGRPVPAGVYLLECGVGNRVKVVRAR